MGGAADAVAVSGLAGWRYTHSSAVGMIENRPGITDHPARAERPDARLEAATGHSRTRPRAVPKPKATGQLSTHEDFISFPVNRTPKAKRTPFRLPCRFASLEPTKATLM